MVAEISQCTTADSPIRIIESHLMSPAWAAGERVLVAPAFRLIKPYLASTDLYIFLPSFLPSFLEALREDLYPTSHAAIG